MGMLMARENEALKNENRMLRDKVSILEAEVNHMNATRPQEHEFSAVRAELENEKRVRFEQQSFDQNELMKQKNEWAEVYGNQTTQIEHFKSELKHLSTENEQLLRKLNEA